MSRATFPSSSTAAAAAFATRTHNRMINQNGDYADAVRKGQITAWAIPYQVTSSPAWFVNVKSRCLDTLSQAERDALDPGP